ncbi:MAG: DUF2953 domain-containing protein [Lachnospiraceae bacterium]|nr:DUF2953 domain-containing protein [Lachnospiraceae bacterium]
MAVFLAVLKIIGIVLLCILALLLVLVLLILFLPIHYKARAEFDKEKGEFKASAKLTFFAYLLHAQADAENSTLSYYVKVFGKRLIDNQSDTDDEEETETAAANQGLQEVSSQIVQAPEKEDGTGMESAKEENAPGEESAAKETLESAKEKTQTVEAGEQSGSSEDAPSKKGGIKSLFERLGGMFEKLRGIYQSVAQKLKNTVYTIQGVYDKIKAAFGKVSYYKELLGLEASREAIRYGWKWLKYLLWHARPRRLNGYLKLGREDPADTGELLGLICTLKPVYGRNFTVVPDFERDVLEGSFYMKGFLQLYVVAVVLAKYYFNKNFMRFVRRLKRGRD